MKLAWCKLEGKTGHEAGRELLKKLYSEETGKDLPPILVTGRGKPYFEGNPLYFSISHTKQHAFCVLSEHPVGVDAEEIARDVNPRLADKVLSEQEYPRYAAARDKNRALLTFWVLKEAAAKLSGEGLRGYPNHTNFTLEDPRVTEIDGCLVAVLENKE